MTASIVIVDDAKPDSVADRMAAVLGRSGPAEVVKLSAFLLDHGLRYNAENAVLDWDDDTPVPDGAPAIYNRVVEVGLGTSHAIHAGETEDDDVPPSFVFDAFVQLLATFPAVNGTPGHRSPVGNLLPLYLQWQAISSRLSDVQTPRFIYGFGAEAIEPGDFTRPIVKPPFDIYNWKETGLTVRPALHPFVVEKPAGTPVIMYFVGTQSEVFVLGEDGIAEPELRGRLLSYLPVIDDVFKAFMGEVLFFVDGDHVVFAAFSHYLKTAAAHPTFDEVLNRALGTLVTAQ